MIVQELDDTLYWRVEKLNGRAYWRVEKLNGRVYWRVEELVCSLHVENKSNAEAPICFRLCFRLDSKYNLEDL